MWSSSAVNTEKTTTEDEVGGAADNTGDNPFITKLSSISITWLSFCLPPPLLIKRLFFPLFFFTTGKEIRNTSRPFSFYIYVVTETNVLIVIFECLRDKIDNSSFCFLIAMDGVGDFRSKFKRICVFCGSNSGNKPVFSTAALDLGHELVKRKIDLVYGGGSVGLMGLISKTVYDGGCRVFGVIPKALVPQEISGEPVGEVKVVSDMHVRKAEMARQSDAFVALPGGYGTMEELLEMITWSQLGIHNKIIGLLNVDGYYNALLSLFDNGVENGFIKPSARHIVVSAPTAKELIMKMEQYSPSHDQVAPSKSWEIAHLDYSKTTP